LVPVNLNSSLKIFKNVQCGSTVNDRALPFSVKLMFLLIENAWLLKSVFYEICGTKAIMEISYLLLQANPNFEFTGQAQAQ
jgi:hypothetical protein